MFRVTTESGLLPRQSSRPVDNRPVSAGLEKHFDYGQSVCIFIVLFFLGPLAAKCSEVHPSKFCLLTHAPPSSSASMQQRWPFLAAFMSAVVLPISGPVPSGVTPSPSRCAKARWSPLSAARRSPSSFCCMVGGPNISRSRSRSRSARATRSAFVPMAFMASNTAFRVVSATAPGAPYSGDGGSSLSISLAFSICVSGLAGL